MTVELLTEHHLEFLSLKGRCTGSSESTLVKMPHCWKSHVMAQMISSSAEIIPETNFASSVKYSMTIVLTILPSVMIAPIMIMKVPLYIRKNLASLHTIIYILREKSLAIIYNGVSHRRSLKHYVFLIGRFANMSVA